jgi:hypothetical protein
MVDQRSATVTGHRVVVSGEDEACDGSRRCSRWNCPPVVGSRRGAAGSAFAGASLMVLAALTHVASIAWLDSPHGIEPSDVLREDLAKTPQRTGSRRADAADRKSKGRRDVRVRQVRRRRHEHEELALASRKLSQRR